MYKAIFTDIDGTLFRSDLTIGERTRDALRKAYGMGIRIVLSSGRYITGMNRAQEQLGIPVIYAAINGALIKDGNEYLRQHRIGREAYMRAAAHLRGKVSSLLAFCETKYALDANDEWYDLQTRICGDEGVRMDITDPEDVYKRTGEYPYKILVKDGDKSKMDKLIREVSAIVGNDGVVISSGSNNFEVLPPDTDKKDALKIVADHLSIDAADTIAFGDWDNDAGMIGNAGLGIAMANGSERAKKAARYITLSNDEDGICHALEKFGII